MIPVRPGPEPEEFDARTRQPGLHWLEQTRGRPRPRPKSFWGWCAEPLRAVFGERCGWLAMYIHDGDVDHFVSWNECRHERPQLAYEWSNYRYASPRLNSRKRAARDLLDPFEVQLGWFRVELPSLQLVCTDAVPREHRERAERTLEVLDLVRGTRVRRLREGWLRRYRHNRLSLEGLLELAPLVGEAVSTLLRTPDEALSDELLAYRRRLVRAREQAGGRVP